MTSKLFRLRAGALEDSDSRRKDSITIEQISEKNRKRYKSNATHSYIVSFFNKVDFDGVTYKRSYIYIGNTFIDQSQYYIRTS